MGQRTEAWTKVSLTVMQGSPQGWDTQPDALMP